MSDGAYLMDKILSRCVEEGDCLLWQGCLAAGYCPCVRYQGVTINVRRWLWAQHGKKLPAKGKAVVVKCKDRRCVALEHLAEGHRGGRKGDRRTPAYALKMAALRQAQSTLTMHDVEQIRASNLPAKELGAQYGKCERTIQNIVAGSTWKVTSGFFAGLGARK
jgi:hypothetical protein